MRSSKPHGQKSVKLMTDGEIVRLHEKRVLTFSWVAFLDGESDRTIKDYYRNAMKRMAEIDNEIVSREIKISCH
jgi:hypothetical protein